MDLSFGQFVVFVYFKTSILWRKDLDSYITPLQVGNERIQYIELSGKQHFLIG
jgi:hypothetical protein